MVDDIQVHCKIPSADVVVTVTVCDSVAAVFQKYFYLRIFYNSITMEKREEIDGAAAITVRLDKRVGNSLYHMVLLDDVSEQVVVHECFHLVMRIMGDKQGVNVVSQSANEEMYAYLLGEVYKIINSVYKGYKR